MNSTNSVASSQIAIDAARQEALMSRYLDALCAVLTTTDCIIAESATINVSASDIGNFYHGLMDAPAFSVGDKIILSKTHLIKRLREARDSVLPYSEMDFMLEAKGLNYHELCHVMFTPSPRSDFMKRIDVLVNENPVNGQLYRTAMNLLEDQRIEMAFVTMYTPAAPFFRTCVMNNILKGLSDQAYLLIAGRYYLSKKLRRSIRDRFLAVYGHSLTNELDSIVREYVTVSYPTDSLRGLQLIKRFVILLNKMNQQAPQPPSPNGQPNGLPDHGCNHDDDARQRGPAGDYKGPGVKEGKRIAEAVDEAISADNADDYDDGSGSDDDTSDGDGEGAPGSGDESTDTTRDVNPDGNAPADMAGGDINARDFADEIDPDDQVGLDDLKVMIENELSEIANDQSLIDELMDMQAAVHSEENLQVELPAKSWPSTPQAPSNSARNLQNRLKTLLARLKLDLEPLWLKRQTSGRINLGRVMMRKPHELDVFDRWDEGSEDEASVEVAVLVDSSGSMSYRMEAASEMAWALKSALYANSIPCTVAGFSTDWAVLYGPNDRPNPAEMNIWRAQNSTIPGAALEAVRKRLSSSPASHKIMLIITDGQWSGTSADQTIELMNRDGVKTGLLGLGQAVSMHGLHNCSFGRDIGDLTEVVQVISDLVSEVMRNARHTVS